MIDGVKLYVADGTAQRFLRLSDNIRWLQNGYFPDGRPRFRGTWMNWHFLGDGERCWEIRGSFHTYAQGGSNWRDYTWKDHVQAVEAFCEARILHPAQLILLNIEIGVNVLPPRPTKALLRTLIHHGLVAPQRNDLGLEFKHDGYRVKVYHKAGANEDLMRFEVKATNMREVAGLGIKTLADTLDPEKWQGIEAFLLKKFDGILVAERVRSTGHLTEKDRELVQDATSLEYWLGLSRSSRTRNRDKLYALCAQLPGYDLRERLRDVIQTKAYELTPRVRPKQVLRIATFTPSVMDDRLGRNPPSSATFTPLIARSADVATRPWVWWRSRGPPKYRRAAYEQA